MTSVSSRSAYAPTSARVIGDAEPSIRTARSAAFVLLLMATVATGIPRCAVKWRKYENTMISPFQLVTHKCRLTGI